MDRGEGCFGLIGGKKAHGGRVKRRRREERTAENLRANEEKDEENIK